MAAIAGAAELLEADLPRADRQAFALQIQDQVQRQRGLVERLLALSKLELRRQLDHSQPVDLLACADGAVAQAQALAQQRGVAISWQAREPLQVMGEAEWLAVAVGNLLDNALDFSPAGSVVELSLFREGHQACLSLRDHGPGVPDFALAKLGQRFYSTPRPAPAGQVPRRGSGLGLAIVREVMAQHGGALVLQHAQPGLLACLKLPLASGG
jgi:two-component system sensor histidine kinase CreC